MAALVYINVYTDSHRYLVVFRYGRPTANIS